MKLINGGVTAPKNFYANGLAAGIKRSGKSDLALIYSETPCLAAGVYTKNSVKAAPLIVTKKNLANGVAQAVIANSGNANCFTGKDGLSIAQRTVQAAARELGIKPADVLVASTGIIGRPLDVAKIETAMPKLVAGLGSSLHKGRQAAKAILTTDTMLKEIAVSVPIGKNTVMIGGCAKGSGMIEPNMATMLAFLTTDAAITQPLLKKAMLLAVEPSFNSITVDGCMSTNDMVCLMANGMAGNKLIATEGDAFKKFVNALTFVCLDLATKIVRDGEGATKLLQIAVSGAKTYKMAKAAAKAIANSNLVKTAAYGKNPNWGRIAGAVGSLGLNVTEKNLKINIQDQGKKHLLIQVYLGLGTAEATVLTCDLTEEYIRINGAYN